MVREVKSSAACTLDPLTLQSWMFKVHDKIVIINEAMKNNYAESRPS